MTTDTTSTRRLLDGVAVRFSRRAMHATHAATALDDAFPAPPPRKSERPMITVTPLVHRGKLPRPEALGGRGSTYDMEPGIIGSHLPWPTDARLPGA